MAKGPGGQPTKYNREFHNRDFIEQSKQGRNVIQIAAKWDVARSSIYLWAEKHTEFSDTLKRGQDLCEAWYANLGQAALMGQASISEPDPKDPTGKSMIKKPIKIDLGFYVWMTKNICKWHDKVEQKDTTPAAKKVTKVEVDMKAQVKEILEELKKEY